MFSCTHVKVVQVTDNTPFFFLAVSVCKANCLLFRVCALTACKEGQLWTVSWCNSLIPHCLAVPYGLIQEVQLMAQALVVVILDIPSKGCCILVCAMAANSSMSVTHRLIPGALSVLSLSQACMYTLRPTLLILLSPLPLSRSLSPSSSSACNSCLSPLLCLCFTFPVLTPLFSAFFAIKGGGEYYHLEPSSLSLG